MVRIWDQENLHAWCVVPFDDAKRGPEARAKMLAELGIRHFAYDWREEHIPEFRRELESLAAHGIDLLAWWWRPELGEELGRTTLELFVQHDVAPRLWVMQGENLAPDRLPRTPELERERREIEAARLARVAATAQEFGLGVDLYTHNDWLGVTRNAIAVVERAKELGARDLGISYNFSHARDEHHDDTVDFPALWSELGPLVSSVNLAGTHFEDGETLLPGDGEHDLEMMRTIEESGWRGPVGVIAESGGDARVTLSQAMGRVRLLAEGLPVLRR